VPIHVWRQVVDGKSLFVRSSGDKSGGSGKPCGRRRLGDATPLGEMKTVLDCVNKRHHGAVQCEEVRWSAMMGFSS
jgi:hypothetical protein